MKTTIFGVLTILGALINAALEFAKTGNCNLVVLGTAITAGWGLIKAEDALK